MKNDPLPKASRTYFSYTWPERDRGQTVPLPRFLPIFHHELTNSRQEKADGRVGAAEQSSSKLLLCCGLA